MGLLWSKRIGSDPYYANYEKAFERLEKECSKILDRRLKRRRTMEQYSAAGFWLTGLAAGIALLVIAAVQHFGSRSFVRKVTTIGVAVAVPILIALSVRAALWLFRQWETRDEKFLKKLVETKRKMIKELKDSTRFDKTIALIKKYDPDEAPYSPKIRDANGKDAPGLRKRRSESLAGNQSGMITPGAPRPGMTPNSLLKPAAYAANLTMEAGKALLPVLDRVANSVIGDNPQLIEDIRRASDEAQALKNENALLRQKLMELAQPTDAQQQYAQQQQDCPPQRLYGDDQNKDKDKPAALVKVASGAGSGKSMQELQQQQQQQQQQPGMLAH